jgi:hypothetical protein
MYTWCRTFGHIVVGVGLPDSGIGSSDRFYLQHSFLGIYISSLPHETLVYPITRVLEKVRYGLWITCCSGYVVFSKEKLALATAYIA